MTLELKDKNVARFHAFKSTLFVNKVFKIDLELKSNFLSVLYYVSEEMFDKWSHAYAIFATFKQVLIEKCIQNHRFSSNLRTFSLVEY